MSARTCRARDSLGVTADLPPQNSTRKKAPRPASTFRRYMIRLRRDDFEDPHELPKFAAVAGMSLQEFRDQFEYLVEKELPPLEFQTVEEKVV